MIFHSQVWSPVKKPKVWALWAPRQTAFRHHASPKLEKDGYRPCSAGSKPSNCADTGNPTWLAWKSRLPLAWENRPRMFCKLDITGWFSSHLSSPRGYPTSFYTLQLSAHNQSSPLRWERSALRSGGLARFGKFMFCFVPIFSPHKLIVFNNGLTVVNNVMTSTFLP